MSMTMEELEAEVMGLKEKEIELDYVKDVMAIWRLNSKYAYLIDNRGREVPDLFG